MTSEERRALSDLMIRLADGDRAACDPLFALLWPLIFSFANKLLAGHADAADAAQRALLRIYARATEFDRDRDALAWALGITRWECRTVARAAERRCEDSIVSDPRVDMRSPESVLLETELLSLFENDLSQLAARDREALGLDASPNPGGPAERKRKQRALARLRLIWRKHDRD
jgi:RNA polymerase sigma factor (sigma-70 family)